MPPAVQPSAFKPGRPTAEFPHQSRFLQRGVCWLDVRLGTLSKFQEIYSSPRAPGRHQFPPLLAAITTRKAFRETRSRMTKLPLEIIYSISDIVSYDHPKALQALALTCKALVPCCQQHIFATIKIWDGPLVAIVYPDRQAHAFAKLISDSPRIASHIRELTVQLPTLISPWITENARETVFHALKEITHLSKLSLRSTKCFCSSIFTNSAMASSITHLLGLGTTTTLNLTGFLEISPSLFSLCPTIRCLMISGTVSAITDKPKHGQNPISLHELHLYMDFGHYKALRSLFSAMIDDHRPVLDLCEMRIFRTSRIEVITAAVRDLTGFGMKRLEDIGIIGVPTSPYYGFANSLKPAAMSLRRLYFSYVNGNLGLLPELSALSQPFWSENAIEIITMNFTSLQNNEFVNESTFSKWSQVASLLSQKSAWPSLRCFNLIVNCRDMTNVEWEQWHQLPEQQLAPLNVVGRLQYTLNRWNEAEVVEVRRIHPWGYT